MTLELLENNEQSVMEIKNRIMTSCLQTPQQHEQLITLIEKNEQQDTPAVKLKAAFLGITYSLVRAQLYGKQQKAGQYYLLSKHLLAVTAWSKVRLAFRLDIERENKRIELQPKVFKSWGKPYESDKKSAINYYEEYQHGLSLYAQYYQATTQLIFFDKAKPLSNTEQKPKGIYQELPLLPLDLKQWLAKATPVDRVSNGEKTAVAAELFLQQAASLRERLHIAYLILQAVDDFHRRDFFYGEEDKAVKFVHRAFVPENLVYRPLSHDVLISNFDLAVPYTQQKAVEYSLAGSPLFIAPEFFHSAATIDYRYDYYAVSAVLANLFSADSTSFCKNKKEAAAEFSKRQQNENNDFMYEQAKVIAATPYNVALPYYEELLTKISFSTEKNCYTILLDLLASLSQQEVAKRASQLVTPMQQLLQIQQKVLLAELGKYFSAQQSQELLSLLEALAKEEDASLKGYYALPLKNILQQIATTLSKQQSESGLLQAIQLYLQNNSQSPSISATAELLQRDEKSETVELMRKEASSQQLSVYSTEVLQQPLFTATTEKLQQVELKITEQISKAKQEMHKLQGQQQVFGTEKVVGLSVLHNPEKKQGKINYIAKTVIPKMENKEVLTFDDMRKLQEHVGVRKFASKGFGAFLNSQLNVVETKTTMQQIGEQYNQLLREYNQLCQARGLVKRQKK